MYRTTHNSLKRKETTRTLYNNPYTSTYKNINNIKIHSTRNHSIFIQNNFQFIKKTKREIPDNKITFIYLHIYINECEWLHTYNHTHLEYRVSTSASMLIPLFKPLCLARISRVSLARQTRDHISVSRPRNDCDRVVETSSPQERWAERAQRSRRGSWKRVEMLNCPPQALTYSTRQRKTHESFLSLFLSSFLSLSLSRHISIKAERTHTNVTSLSTYPSVEQKRAEK